MNILTTAPRSYKDLGVSDNAGVVIACLHQSVSQSAAPAGCSWSASVWTTDRVNRLINAPGERRLAQVVRSTNELLELELLKVNLGSDRKVSAYSRKHQTRQGGQYNSL